MSRRFCFASAQSINWRNHPGRFALDFAGHPIARMGDGTSVGLRQRLSQITSSARSFSAVVIWSSGRVRSIESPPSNRSDGLHHTDWNARPYKAKRMALYPRPQSASAIGRVVRFSFSVFHCTGRLSRQMLGLGARAADHELNCRLGKSRTRWGPASRAAISPAPESGTGTRDRNAASRPSREARPRTAYGV